MFRDPYAGCLPSKCIACSSPCWTATAPRFLEARLRVDARRARRIADMARIDYADMRILEIGSGFGTLASHLAGSAKEYLGTEPSPEFHRIQLESFDGLVGRVVNAVLPDERRKGGFDLVIAVNILQNVAYPLEFLSEVVEYLREGGLLYVEVPDESRLPVRAAVRRVLGLYRGEPVHHGHANFFTGGSLRRLMTDVGLDVQAMEPLSLASDMDRVYVTLRARVPWYLKVLCSGARATGADILLGLGNLTCLGRKAGGRG